MADGSFRQGYPRQTLYFSAQQSATSAALTDADDDRPVLVSDIVTFTSEYRLLVFDGRVHTGSRYLTSGHPDVRALREDTDRSAVMDFADALLDAAADTLPSAVTVDVGWAVDADSGDEGFAVVEANMAWFSNIYACQPERALDVVMRAAGPTGDLSDRDRPFVRTVGSAVDPGATLDNVLPTVTWNHGRPRVQRRRTGRCQIPTTCPPRHSRPSSRSREDG
ncbi:DUF4343 domain-containing protein [Nakamurella silvestris]|nr:DUF4343 domain-containing protein [Nakamurella silvestris]